MKIIRPIGIRGTTAVVTMLVFSAAFATETGIGGFLEYSASLRGNFVTAGASTRVLAGPPQVNPFNVTIAGIPAGSVIKKAFANWGYLTDVQSAPIEAAIKINGVNVNGVMSGAGEPDLRWGRQYAQTFSQDITAIVAAAGGNGIYSIADALDEPSTNGIGEGFSMVVVYENPNEPLRQVNVDIGYTSTTSGDGKGSIRFGQGAYIGGPVKFFINAMDGQDNYSDDFFVNDAPAWFALGGLTPFDSWQGRKGPGPVGRNYFDIYETDASPVMNIGDVELEFQTLGGGNGDDQGYTDCVGHSITAISMIVPEPSSTLALVGGLLLLRRRMRGGSRK